MSSSWLIGVCISIGVAVGAFICLKSGVREESPKSEGAHLVYSSERDLWIGKLSHHNATDEVVSIDAIQTSCNCLTAIDSSQLPISVVPKSTLEIPLEFSPGRRVGLLTGRVLVSTSSEHSGQRIEAHDYFAWVPERSGVVFNVTQVLLEGDTSATFRVSGPSTILKNKELLMFDDSLSIKSESTESVSSEFEITELVIEIDGEKLSESEVALNINGEIVKLPVKIATESMGVFPSAVAIGDTFDAEVLVTTGSHLKLLGAGLSKIDISRISVGETGGVRYKLKKKAGTNHEPCETDLIFVDDSTNTRRSLLVVIY